MDFAIATEVHFGRLDPDGTEHQEIPPIQCRQFVSYERMTENWEDARKQPTQAELQTAYDAWETAQSAKAQQAQAEKDDLLTARANYGGIDLSGRLNDPIIGDLVKRLELLELEVANLRAELSLRD